MNTFLQAEISLVFAGDGVPPVKEGQPAFWLHWQSEIALFEEPTWFFRQEIVSKSSAPSKNTWSAAAHDLKVWFQYLQAKRINWTDANEETRQDFADDFASAISPRTGRNYEAATINRRLVMVRRFYGFAETQGWYWNDIGQSVRQVVVGNRPIDDDALAHVRPIEGKVVDRDFLLRKVGRKDVVRPLQVAQLRTLLNHVGPEAPKQIGDMRRIRDRLILDLGWVCGLRLGDTISLTTLKILGLPVANGQELHKFPIVVENGKGGVTRTVGVPGWLLLGLQSYIHTERKESEKFGGGRRTHALFLGHADSKSAGKAITRSAIQKMFSLNCLQAGITESKSFHDPDTGKSLDKVVAAHSFHDLRHNCAVLTNHAEKSLGNPEPWKVVQLTLGHKHLTTTIDTYLAHVEIFGERQGVLDTRQLVRLRKAN